MGDEIPYIAQVFQVVDIYDALTSERPYKQAFTSEKALEIIAEETARGWRNPQLVEKFTTFIRTTEMGTPARAVNRLQVVESDEPAAIAGSWRIANG